MEATKNYFSQTIHLLVQCSSIYLSIHIYPPTNPCYQILAHPLIYSTTQSTYPFIYPFTHIHPRMHSFTYSPIHQSIYSSIHTCDHTSIHSSVNLSTLSISSFSHYPSISPLLRHSFMYSSIHLPKPPTIHQTDGEVI